MPHANRIPGHTLVAEGAPFAPDYPGTRRLMGKGGSGLCSCGILSSWLNSNTQRKAWHRDVHKPEVRGA